MTESKDDTFLVYETFQPVHPPNFKWFYWINLPFLDNGCVKRDWETDVVGDERLRDRRGSWNSNLDFI